MIKNIFDFYIDRGGTFTDVFYRIQKGNDIEESVLKLLSEDPSNYKDAPCEAIKRITMTVFTTMPASRKRFKTEMSFIHLSSIKN